MTIMEPIETTMEIKDNTFARQFETIVPEGLLSVEYSFQEKKIFLTKINTPEGFENQTTIDVLLKNIMEIIIEKKFKLMPIYPRIVLFIKKNPEYKELLPPGIRI
ncbi:GNAT family N-acetyltransferase [Flavobacterium hibernum]|nr:N-acetyltransferase [Flavobacterium hibernum]